MFAVILPVYIPRLILMLTAVFFVTHAQAENTKILAEVNGEPVTNADYQIFIESLGKNLDRQDSLAQPTDQPELFQEFLQSVLIAQDAAANGISIGDDEIESYMSQVAAKNSVDKIGLKKLLAEQGLSERGYRLRVKNEILRLKLITKVIRPKVSIDETEDANPQAEDPQQPVAATFQAEQVEQVVENPAGTIHVEQILVSIPKQPSDQQKQEFRAQIKELLEQAFAGADFMSLHRKGYSDLGKLPLTDLREEFQNAIAVAHPLGNYTVVSDPLIGPGGAFIIKASGLNADFYQQILAERKNREAKTEQHNLQASGLEKKILARADQYFSQELPKKYFVDIKTNTEMKKVY
ncbi:SurA N-terminal domain-containing protein [bacterium]|nr:SurA N-terminal domain-containing protein [bacterium]